MDIEGGMNDIPDPHSKFWEDHTMHSSNGGAYATPRQPTAEWARENEERRNAEHPELPITWRERLAFYAGLLAITLGVVAVGDALGWAVVWIVDHV
jgi:hypothetical protein